MKKRLLALSLILAGIFSTSCLTEDYSDCYRTYKLMLSYKGDGKQEIFPEKINRVEMYVFDEEQACVSSSVLPDGDVAARSTMLPDLKPGNYRIICVGNTHETGLENLDSRDYSKILFAADPYLAGQTVSGNDSLYYASVNYTVEAFDPMVSEETVTAEFVSSHYDILVELVNVPEWAGNPRIELVGVSPATDFENIAKGQPADYVMDAVNHGKGYITAENNIMRHNNHDEVYLKVTGEDGRSMALVNFGEHLEKNKDYIDPTLNECLIPFRLEWDPTVSTEIVIGLPAWIVENVTPDFHKR